MKAAVIGSRNIAMDLSKYISEGTTAIIIGGAKGIDICAANYVRENGLELVYYLSTFKLYG